MLDSARVARAVAVEIPVTIQGSKVVEGSENRELFTESTKTTLAFDNGAILNLRSKIAPGQSLFLRNEQSGREVICRVVETELEGQGGSIELEFIAPNPEFWGVRFETLEATANEPAPAKEDLKTEASQQNPPATTSENATTGSTSQFALRAPLGAELVPTHEAISEVPNQSPAIASPNESGVPTGEQIDAALRTIAAASPSPPVPGGPASNDAASIDATDAKNLATLIAIEAERARRTAAEKQKQEAKRAVASPGTPEAAVDAEAVDEPEIVVAKPSLQERLTTGKGALVVEILASVVILVAMGFIWHAVAPLFARGMAQPTRTESRSKPRSAARPAPPAAQGLASEKPAAVGAASSMRNSSSAAPAPGVVNAAPRPAPSPASPLEPVGPGSAATRRIPAPASASVVEQAKELRPEAPKPSGMIPAKIVWEVQPEFPSWAKALEVEGVVKLDVLIDEKGNVKETRVLSGPRPLQHAAQQAVGLWIFEPAQLDGKPTASHLMLSVEFQR